MLYIIFLIVLLVYILPYQYILFKHKKWSVLYIDVFLLILAVIFFANIDSDSSSADSSNSFEGLRQPFYMILLIIACVILSIISKFIIILKIKLSKTIDDVSDYDELTNKRKY